MAALLSKKNDGSLVVGIVVAFLSGNMADCCTGPPGPTPSSHFFLLLRDTTEGALLPSLLLFTPASSSFCLRRKWLGRPMGGCVPGGNCGMSAPSIDDAVDYAGDHKSVVTAAIAAVVLWFARAPIEIHGSDGSPAAIARARAGRYRDRAFRTLPEQFKTRYFRADGDAWRPTDHLSARITSWSVVNLVDDAIVTANAARCAVIFCRNLFIYFSETTIRSVVERLAKAMPSPGYLCIGASESLLRITNRFCLEEIGGAFVYVRQP